MNLIDSILADAQAIAAIRRDIHAHPELCFQEQRTRRDRAALTDWGIPMHRGMGTTGVVGIVRNGTSDRAVGLRADIDALPMTEHNTFAHASRHTGSMHACGHDGHTAMLLAAAKHLAKHRNFDGTVYLVFQPAEEGGGGAREMIKDGLFERFPMEAIFGAHNWPGMAAGQFALKPGRCSPAPTSSGSRSAARARTALPHNGIDPVPVACQMVQAFQTIVTRNKRPIDTAVISVTMIHAGEATNVIPDQCELQGTVRTFTTEVLDLIERACSASPRPPAKRSKPSASSSSTATTRRRSTTRPRRNSCADARRGGRRGQRARIRADDGRRGLQLLPAREAGLLLPDRQRRRHPPRGRPRHGPVHAAQPELRLQRRADPAGRHRLGAPGRTVAGHAARLIMAVDPSAFFAQTYAGARAGFLAAAAARGLGVQSYPHPLLGMDGEPLAMDVLRDGPADAEALLLVSSACHGVEGFCGSGVQRALLADDGFREAAMATGVAVLYIHALNPWGFSWWRRTTHENVDLNRNFHDFHGPLPANPGYDELATAIVPAHWPSPEAEARLAAYAAAQGERALQTAVTAGQYAHPEGLFYGGRAPTWSQQTLRHVLQDHGRRCHRLGWIDLHTGLGPSGHGERIFACRDDAEVLARARAWWGPEAGRRTGMPPGRVHRDRDGVRHAAGAAGDRRPARRPVAGEPPADRRGDARGHQARHARRLLHRHRRLEDAHRRAGPGRRAPGGGRAFAAGLKPATGQDQAVSRVSRPAVDASSPVVSPLDSLGSSWLQAPCPAPRPTGRSC
jgi:amidohydrolase